MDIFKSFATDSALEVNGRWVPLSKTAKVLVARAGNDKFARCMKTLLERNGIDLKDDSEENLEAVNSLVVEAMAETILLGWEGLTFNGAELPYNKPNAVKVLGIKDFKRKIEALSEDVASYRVKEETDQGNA